MKLQKLLDEYKYNKKNQESIKKEIIRVVQNFFDIDAYTLIIERSHWAILKLTIVFKWTNKSLSLKHSFVTEFTTMIVVDEDKGTDYISSNILIL